MPTSIAGRRIQILSCPRWGYVQVGENYHTAFMTLSRFADRNGKVRFARRPFAGASSAVFTVTKLSWYLNGQPDVFITNVNGQPIEMCADVARKILGLGKTTKKFTVWYKPVNTVA